MARRILTEFVMDKIAAVDRPCQEHATVTIMKRAPEVDCLTDDAAMEALRSLAMLRTSVLKVKVKKAWSDAARLASAEARRKAAGITQPHRIDTQFGGRKWTYSSNHPDTGAKRYHGVFDSRADAANSRNRNTELAGKGKPLVHVNPKI